MKAAILFILLCVGLHFTATSQVPPTQTPTVKRSVTRSTPVPLQYQFNGLKSRSSSYREFNQDYKVIRVSSLDAFWKNVQDSLRAREQNIRKAGKATEQALVQTRKELAAQQAELQTLKQANIKKEQKIQQTEHDIASLSVLGLDVNKQVYVVFSWIVIIGLVILTTVFYFLYKKSKVVTDEKIKAFETINQEYTTHKQSARERELKIKRDLQTESNKVDELNQEIALLRKQVQM